MANIVIIFHSQSGKNLRLAQAISEGLSKHQSVQWQMLRASEASVDVLWEADLLVVVTPENIGSLAGGMKDFFDRTFYPFLGRGGVLPYALVVGCGNDGRGAEKQMQTIAMGMGLKAITETYFVRGEPSDAVFEDMAELGQALAEGAEMGIF